LQRIWSLGEENRKAKIVQFAKEHGLQLSFYKQGLCAIFEKESDPSQNRPRETIKRPNKGEVTNMRGKQKKTKKRVKVDDLKPAKDPKGGMPQGPPQDLKWLLKHLQLGQRRPGGGR